MCTGGAQNCTVTVGDPAPPATWPAACPCTRSSWRQAVDRPGGLHAPSCMPGSQPMSPTLVDYGFDWTFGDGSPNVKVSGTPP